MKVLYIGGATSRQCIYLMSCSQRNLYSDFLLSLRFDCMRFLGWDFFSAVANYAWNIGLWWKIQFELLPRCCAAQLDVINGWQREDLWRAKKRRCVVELEKKTGLRLVFLLIQFKIQFYRPTLIYQLWCEFKNHVYLHSNLVSALLKWHTYLLGKSAKN